MYTFANLNLDHLKGCEITEISIVPYNILFKLEPKNFINISGKWSLLSKDGIILDHGDAQAAETSPLIHNLLNSKIESYSTPIPTELHITFINGSALIIYDDPQYECCSISPNIYI